MVAAAGEGDGVGLRAWRSATGNGAAVRNGDTRAPNACAARCAPAVGVGNKAQSAATSHAARDALNASALRSTAVAATDRADVVNRAPHQQQDAITAATDAGGRTSRDTARDGGRHAALAHQQYARAGIPAGIKDVPDAAPAADNPGLGGQLARALHDHTHAAAAAAAGA
ncbi:hypothetical protein D3C78_1281530 [compost metagenome]